MALSFGAFKKKFLKTINLAQDTKKLLFVKGSSTSVDVHFIIDGEFKVCKMYTDDYWIELWANHFKEYATTGKFDFSGEWQIYASTPEEMNPEDENKTYNFPLVSDHDEDCYQHSPELNKFLMDYRKTYPKCGIKFVGKKKKK